MIDNIIRENRDIDFPSTVSYCIACFAWNRGSACEISPYTVEFTDLKCLSKSVIKAVNHIADTLQCS